MNPIKKSAPEDVSEITSSTKEELSSLQQEILQKLKTAKNSEARVRMYGNLVDTYGVDALIGIIPGLGDAAPSIVSGLYLLFEARAAGLSKTEYLKIIGLQATDCFIGMIPVVGNIADYFFKTNNWSADYFEERTKELEQKAREAGIDESRISQIRERAEKLPQMVKKVVDIKQAI